MRNLVFCFVLLGLAGTIISRQALALTRYDDPDKNSGIEAFDIGADWIVIVFKSGRRYRYTENQVGPVHLEEMKRLALAGNGLNAYINKNVKKK